MYRDYVCVGGRVFTSSGVFHALLIPWCVLKTGSAQRVRVPSG